jgi:hypothetical protein
MAVQPVSDRLVVATCDETIVRTKAQASSCCRSNEERSCRMCGPLDDETVVADEREQGGRLGEAMDTMRKDANSAVKMDITRKGNNRRFDGRFHCLGLGS